jgi:hypothetical protein
MQGNYTYIPETNHVPNQYNVAAILSLLFMVPILLLIYFFLSGSSAQRGLWPPRSRGFLSHTMTRTVGRTPL